MAGTNTNGNIDYGSGKMARAYQLVDSNGLPIDATGYASAVTVTRPSNTNTYGAGDVVGAAVNAALTFANIGPSAGGEVLITSSTFERDVSALITGETSYTLHLYNVTPPSGMADEATFDLSSGDRAAYLGSINLGTPVDLGATLYVAQDGLNKQVTLLSSSLFAYLVTVGGHVAASATVARIGLHSVRL